MVLGQRLKVEGQVLRALSHLERRGRLMCPLARDVPRLAATISGSVWWRSIVAPNLARDGSPRQTWGRPGRTDVLDG
jgi:hypothetical protein